MDESKIEIEKDENGEEFYHWILSEEEIALINNSITTSEYLEKYRKENSKSFKFSKGRVNVFSNPKTKARLHNSGQFISGKFKGFGRFIKEDVYGKAIKGTLRYSKEVFDKINYNKVGIALKKTALFPFNNIVMLKIREGRLNKRLKKLNRKYTKRSTRRFVLLREFRKTIIKNKIDKVGSRKIKVVEQLDTKTEKWKNLGKGIENSITNFFNRGKEKRAKRKVKGSIPELA